MSAIGQVGILLAVALVWLLANVKAGQNWLKFVTIVGFVVFMVLASSVAVRASGVL